VVAFIAYIKNEKYKLFVIQIQMVCLTKAVFVPGWADVPKARHPCSSHYL